MNCTPLADMLRVSILFSSDAYDTKHIHTKSNSNNKYKYTNTQRNNVPVSCFVFENRFDGNRFASIELGARKSHSTNCAYKVHVMQSLQIEYVHNGYSNIHFHQTLEVLSFQNIILIIYIFSGVVTVAFHTNNKLNRNVESPSRFAWGTTWINLPFSIKFRFHFSSDMPCGCMYDCIDFFCVSPNRLHPME